MSDANYALSTVNGGVDEARRSRLVFTGTLTATRTITLPSVAKNYLVTNLTNQSLIITCGGGFNTTLPTLHHIAVFADAVNVTPQISYLPNLVLGDLNLTNFNANGVSTALSPNGLTPGRLMVTTDTTFGAWRFVTSSGGYLEITANGAAYAVTATLSDLRAKQDVRPAAESALDKIAALEFVDFRFRADPDTQQRGGIIAQQAQAIEPTWVHEVSDGSLHLNPAALLPNALQAIAELRAQVAELSARLDAQA